MPGRRKRVGSNWAQERAPSWCHSEPFAVILSEAKDLALGAQGKLREQSRTDSSTSKQGETPRCARNAIATRPDRVIHASKLRRMLRRDN
jgi:hypothetical protein